MGMADALCIDDDDDDDDDDAKPTYLPTYTHTQRVTVEEVGGMVQSPTYIHTYIHTLFLKQQVMMMMMMMMMMYDGHHHSRKKTKGSREDLAGYVCVCVCTQNDDITDLPTYLPASFASLG